METNGMHLQASENDKQHNELFQGTHKLLGGTNESQPQYLEIKIAILFKGNQ